MASWVAAWPQKIGATSQNASPVARRYMPGAPEIYFHKPIDNSRLVRSDDPKRKREMRAFAATLAVCFMMMLMYLCQHCSSIEYGYKIEDLRAQREQLAEVNRTLKLEQATLKEPGRIDFFARKMGMALPAVGQVQRLDDANVHDSGAPVMARANNISVVSFPN
jgi:cell division protein FtsL